MNEKTENVIFIPESKSLIVNGIVINEKDLSKEELERLKKNKNAKTMKPLFGEDLQSDNKLIFG